MQNTLMRGADGRLYEIARGAPRVVDEPARAAAPAAAGRVPAADDHVAGRMWISPAPPGDEHVAGRMWISPAPGNDEHVAGRMWISPAPQNDEHVAGRMWISPAEAA